MTFNFSGKGLAQEIFPKLPSSTLVNLFFFLTSARLLTNIVSCNIINLLIPLFFKEIQKLFGSLGRTISLESIIVVIQIHKITKKSLYSISPLLGEILRYFGAHFGLCFSISYHLMNFFFLSYTNYEILYVEHGVKLVKVLSQSSFIYILHIPCICNYRGYIIYNIYIYI